MNNFILYKDRNFSELLSDSINFFKIHLKNYLKNFAIINGALIAAIVVLGFVSFYDVLFSDKTFEFYNSDFLIKIGILGIFVLITTIFISAFPISYFTLLEKENKNDFSISEIFDTIKKQVGRLFFFSLLTIFTFGFAFILFSAIVIFIPFIGIIFYYIISIAFSIIMGQAFILYVKDKTPFFTAWKISFNNIKENFWQKIGATLAMLVISHVITYISVLISIVITGLLYFGNIDTNVQIITNILMYSLLAIIIFVTMNLNIVLQFMIYYSSQKEKIIFNDLDTIGK